MPPTFTAGAVKVVQVEDNAKKNLKFVLYFAQLVLPLYSMKRNILTILLCCFVLASWGKDVVWYSGRGSVEYSFVGKRTGVVDMALNMFAEDMRAVTGHRAEHRAGAVIEIFELDKMRDKDFRRLQRRQVPIDRIIAKDDAFAICVEGGHIVVLGSNANGTAYGILELSRLAGVSPWAWWGDVTPLRRHYLALASDYLTIQWPSVARRGFVAQGHGLDSHRLHQLLLRLRGNLLRHADCDGRGAKCMEIGERWLPSTQPGRIYAEMKTAYDQGARREWVARIDNPRTVAYQLSLFMDMAWNITYVNATNIPSHFHAWLTEQFGEQAADRLLPVLTEYYHLVGIRRPEQMDVEFMADAFGNELERYLANYEALVKALTPIAALVPQERSEAFFAWVDYPVRAAWLMAVKQLQAQEARHIGRPSSFARDDEALSSAVRSWTAYQQLLALNRKFSGMLDGKWEHTLSLAHMPLMAEPKFPGPLSHDAIKRFAQQGPELFNLDVGNTITRNACHFRRATQGVQTVSMLGHSMKAVMVPPGGSLSYSFFSELRGKAVVRVAAIAMPDYLGHDIRLAVRVDDGEAQIVSVRPDVHSPQWQIAEQRGQVIVNVDVNLTRNSHDIEIRALDTPVFIDQLMVDYDPVREFYIFPVTAEQL